MVSNKLDYILLTIIIALNGFEVIYRASLVIQIGIMLFVALCFFYRKHTFKLKFWFYISPFLFTFILQGLYINELSLGVANAISVLVKLLTGYMVITSIKEKFHSTFVNLMYFFAVISLLLFPTQFSESLTHSIKEFADSVIKPVGTENLPEGYRSSTLVLFTYQHAYGHQDKIAELRNCGPFWEPGMFAVFLVPALMMNLFINRKPVISKKNIVFIVATATTFSTTGIIALLLVLFINFFVSLNKTKKVVYFPILMAFIFIGYHYIWKLEFIEGKIKNNILISNEDRRSRFGAMLYHYSELKNSPFIGASLKIAVEDNNLEFKDKLVSPNGLSLVFFNWGVIIGTLYFVFFYRGLKNWLAYMGIYKPSIYISFFSIFCLLAFSQDLTSRYFYLMILMFGLCYSKSNRLNILDKLTSK